MAGLIDAIAKGVGRGSREHFVRVLVQRYDPETGAIYVIYPPGSTNVVGPLYSASGLGTLPGATVLVQVVGTQLVRVYP